MLTTFHCDDCKENICDTCSDQCHYGHNISTKETDEKCSCSHQNPKIKSFAMIFEENELERLRKLLLAKYKETVEETLKERNPEFAELANLEWKYIKEMVGRMDASEITRDLGYRKDNESQYPSFSSSSS